MGRRPEYCSICDKPSEGKMYCTDACKMRAYRRRKQQREMAQLKTIDMSSYQIQQQLVQKYGQPLENALGSYFEAFGKRPYVAMLELLAAVTVEKRYHAVGD